MEGLKTANAWNHERMSGAPSLKPSNNQCLFGDEDSPQKDSSLQANNEEAESISKQTRKLPAPEGTRMDYCIDKATATVEIKVTQKESGKVIREIPTGIIRTPGIDITV